MLKFFIPATTSRDHLLKFASLLENKEQPHTYPFAQTIVSPLFCRPSTLDIIRINSKHGCVIFDSGGFYVQQGRVTLSDLTRQLRSYYSENDWANHYVLPDDPPTPKDSPQVAEERSRRTLVESTRFYSSLPNNLQQKAIGVIHSISEKHLQELIDQYLAIGVSYLAFGSFGMSGPSLAINRVTYSSLEVLIHLSNKVRKANAQLHVFGVGSPAQMVIFHALGISSFDSSGWLRTAAFGSIYMPFLGAFNISNRTKLRSRQCVDEIDFKRISEDTAHSCKFCRDFNLLRENWINRALHNLLVMKETVAMVNSKSALAIEPYIEQLLRKYSPQFFKYWSFIRDF